MAIGIAEYVPSSPSNPPVEQAFSDEEIERVTTGTSLSIALWVKKIAKQHEVVFTRTGLDDFADTAARLSDAEAELDEIGYLLIALVRAGILTGRQNILLLANYLR